jgi:hypothetical protein
MAALGTKVLRLSKNSIDALVAGYILEEGTSLKVVDGLLTS